MLSELLLLLLFTPILATLSYYIAVFIVAGRRKTPEASSEGDGRLSLEVLIPVRSEPVSLVSQTALRASTSLKGSCARGVTVLSDDDSWYADELRKMIRDSRVRVIRRDRQLGGRTGALDEYFFKHALADYVLVIDADAILDENAVREVCKKADGNTVLILPWRAYYKERTRVAETMKFITDMGTTVLYLMRSRAGFFAFPLGSGTAFPVRVIREINGWGPGIVQDDIHIGVKLALAGYETKVLEGSSVEVLVPSKLRSLRKQQRRWAYGTSEVLSRSFLPLLKARNMPLSKRLEMILYMAQPLQLIPLFLSFLLAPLAAVIEPGVSLSEVFPVLAGLATATSFLIAVYVWLYIRLTGLREKTGKVLANVGRFAAILVVLAPVLSLSAVRGLMRLGMPFEVTPKGEKEKALQKDSLPLLEAAYALASSALSLVSGNAVAILLSTLLLAVATYAAARLS